MADQFLITPYKVRSAGTDVPPEEVQAAINSLAQQTTLALNSVASDPTGPAGGDLGGTYPNPTVVKLHVTSGTESGVTITGSTVDSTPVGATTPSTVAGTSVFAGGGTTPAVTATGTQVWNGPNPTVQFIDSIRSAGNKNAFITWGSTVLAFGFANDAFTSFTNALTITGGFTAGISGIASSSGTGAWAHTGGFSASGGINSTNVGATTPGTGAFTALTSTSGAFNGTVGATTPNTGSFTTLAASGAVSGAGFTARFASPGPIGNTAASTGAFTTLTASTAIGVASGGTGAATLTAHGVLLGEGTSPITATAVGTTGQALIGQTGADPVFGFPTGALIGVRVITSTGTYTPTAGTNSVVVELQAAGGGSGGIAATGAATVSASTGSGAGAYAKVRFTTGFSGVTVTIGAVGAAGTSAPGAGGNGATSSFGALISCPGGNGTASSPATGTGGGIVAGAAQTAAPTISGGTTIVSVAGAGTTPSIVLSSAQALSFPGANSMLGVGGSNQNTVTGAATQGSGFGAGASSAVNSNSQAAQAGAAGLPAVCVVYEYA